MLANVPTMNRYCLRYQFMDVPVGDGDFLIGRVDDCDLVLDDVLVSRKHARVRATDTGLHLEDLDSRNGVLLNGRPIEGSAELVPGDVINIGAQQLLVKDASRRGQDAAPGTRDLRVCPQCNRVLAQGNVCPACSAVRHSDATALGGAFEPPMTSPGASLAALVSIADKAMNLGRTVEAERILRSMYGSLVMLKGTPRPTALSDVLAACHCALRMAEVTRKGVWLDYPLEVCTDLQIVMPGELIDELFRVAGRLRYKNPGRTREYLNWLRGQANLLAATERFSLSRLEGLERMLGGGA